MKLFNLYLVSDDSDYTSDVSYPINSQANVNYPVPSMSQSNQDSSSTTVTKKPSVFVQPLIRDSSRRSNQDQVEKTNSFNQQDPLSYVSQPKKMTPQFSQDQP
jgi:hypothetical protein